REAARAIESHRERWRLPDVPLTLDAGREETRRHVDELRVLTACRAADRARTIGHERDLAVASR
ncbi:MAG TPA: hypothetical protein VLL25_01310, partial [Acidimicrobiales bacterium]|nr:hypothetical protein [Acidimicrobiales bacterium]